MAQEQVKALKEKIVADLHDKVGANLGKYFSDSSDAGFFHPDEDVRILSSVQYDPNPLKRLSSSVGGEYDIENARLVYQSFPDLTPYKACDERIWVYLTHGPCFAYTQKRWLDGKKSWNEDRKVKLIQRHFFVRGGVRGWQRNNAISHLWWSAHIASKCNDLDFEKALEILLHQTDLRKSIVERPSISQSAKVFSAIMKVLENIYDEGEKDFFQRKSGRKAPYLEFTRFINRHGGTRFLDALSEKDLRNLMKNLADEARVA